jgi:hypothetical protein
LLKITCAIYKIDPSEIGFPMSGSSEVKPMFEGNNEARLKFSKDKGLKPLLKFWQQKIQRYVIEQLNPEFEFSFVGLEAESAQEQLEADVKKVTNFETVNEVRRRYGLEDLEDGDTILNPVMLQAKQMAMMGGQESNEAIDDEYGSENPFEKAISGYLEKLNTFPTLYRQIRAWLKAGVMDDKELFTTSEGTPQGGVISPLLANIALHGIEYRIKQTFPRMYPHNRETWFHKRGTYFATPDVIRYADDFVILHEDITVAQRCKEIISEWLKNMGLELKRKEMELARVQVARQEMELRVLEREDEIARLYANMEIQRQTELKIKEEISKLKGE